MKIYTKRGDKGKTGLYSNKGKVSKNSLIIKALGKLDQLNSFLGIVVSLEGDKKLKLILKEIQRNIFIISSIIAGKTLNFGIRKTIKLESIIDDLDRKLPKLHDFILPGGSKTGSYLHFCRSLARESETIVVALNEKAKVKSSILKYLNRLSDTLFILARYVNFCAGMKEERWRK